MTGKCVTALEGSSSPCSFAARKCARAALAQSCHGPGTKRDTPRTTGVGRRYGGISAPVNRLSIPHYTPNLPDIPGQEDFQGEQIVWLLKGKIEFRLGNEQRMCGPGDVVAGGAEHEAWFREDTEVIDFFAPSRDDFLLGGKPAYMSQG